MSAEVVGGLAILGGFILANVLVAVTNPKERPTLAERQRARLQRKRERLLRKLARPGE